VNNPRSPTPLSPEEVHVWSVPLGEPGSSWQQPWSILSDDERQRAERFLVERPRRQFVRTRAALRTILAGHLSTTPERVRLAYDTLGKPRLAEQDRAHDVRFNVAHSGELALIAVTLDTEVGTDIEKLRPVHHLEPIAKRFFSPAEAERIEASDQDRRTTSFLQCWTGKEAVLKAMGAGLSYPLAQFEVPTDGETSRWIDLPAHRSFAKARCWLQPVCLGGSYLGAVATLGALRHSVFMSYGEAR